MDEHTNQTNYNDVVLNIGEMSFKLMLDENLIDRGNTAGFHSHAYYELFYVAKGKMNAILPDRIISISGGCFFFMPTGAIHTTSLVDPATERFNIYFQVLSGKNSRDWQSFNRMFASLEPHHSCNNEQLYDTFLRMFQYYNSTNPSKPHLMAACFYEMLYLCKAAENSEDADTSTLMSNLDEDYRVYLIDHSINRLFASDMSLAALAEQVVLSKSQLNRILTKKYGQSFKQRLIFLRMENAARLLLDTQLMIKEIAASVGYNTIQGFNSIFKKTYGMTPEEYRIANRKE